MSDPLAFLAGGGEASRMIARRDWTGHPLGHPKGWPAELKSALSLVLNSPESMILAWGPELSFFFNETYFPLLGPRLPWAMGERFDRVWADGWEQAKPIIDAAFAGKSERFVDLPWKLGEDRGARDTWWTFSYSRVLDASGTVAGLFIFTNETTQRVLADAQLRKSEERLALTFEAAGSMGWWDWDIPDNKLYANATFARMYGVDPEAAAAGAPIEAFIDGIHPDDRGWVGEKIEAALATAGEFAEEYRLLLRDGSVAWVFARGRCFHDAEGRPLRYPGVSVDITARKNLEQERQASEERLRLIIEGASDYAIITTDPGGLITNWSAGAEEIFGRSSEEMVGQEADVIFTQEDRLSGVPAQELRTAAEQGVAGDVRWHQRPDGGRVFMDGTVRPLPRDASGRERGFIKIARNTTAEKLTSDRQTALVSLGDRLRDADTADEVALASAQLLGVTLGAMRASYGDVDSAAETLVVYPDWAASTFIGLTGTYHFRDYGSYIDDLKRGEMVVVSDVTADPRTSAKADAWQALGVRSLVNVAILDHGQFVGLVLVHFDRLRTFGVDELTFIQAVADRTQAAISRLHAQRQQKVLNEELSHRLKNTLTLVQAIADQTLRANPDREAVDAFVKRLHTLGSAHDVLLRQSWQAAPMLSVVASVLQTFGPFERFDISGPDVKLGPRTALSLSLLLHELATNALKYGSLSTDFGRVSLTWDVTDSGSKPVFSLHWRESGGPPAREPDRRGFGSRLIRSGLVGTGGVELRYLASGFEADMTAPLAHVQEA